MKARIQGIASQMVTFQFLFNLLLSENILRHTDKLSQTLQNPNLSSVQGHEIAMLTVKTLQSMHTDRDFDLFWAKIESNMTLRNQYYLENAEDHFDMKKELVMLNSQKCQRIYTDRSILKFLTLLQ